VSAPSSGSTEAAHTCRIKPVTRAFAFWPRSALNKWAVSVRADVSQFGSSSQGTYYRSLDMNQDYMALSEDEHELLEKQSLRTVVQAVQEYSHVARDVFENTRIVPGEETVSRIAEDLSQEACTLAECYPIGRRFGGAIDYKRVRWFPTVFGLIPQALLVDAKAATESSRVRLQQAQISMTAEYQYVDKLTGATVVQSINGLVPPDMEVLTYHGTPLKAVTTSIFLHYHYNDLHKATPPFRRLRSIIAVAQPHRRLKLIYNPSSAITFYQEGPERSKSERVRITLSKLEAMQPWRVQRLIFSGSSGHSIAQWQDTDPVSGFPMTMPFEFLQRGAL
jgi:Type II restriction enzyme SfiI